MKSALRGKTISAVEVGRVGRDGFCLLVDERELFVPFKLFPWFADATIRQIAAVERPSPHHLRWPDLDVDLALASIEHPERFPLASRCSAGAPGPARAAGAAALAQGRSVIEAAEPRMMHAPLAPIGGHLASDRALLGAGGRPFGAVGGQVWSWGSAPGLVGSAVRR